jgi:hypothetical protein
LFSFPTPADFQKLRQQAQQHQANARLSGRREQQAALPQGQREVFQVKLVLLRSKPPIWRKLLIPADLSLPSLHLVLQIAMGWENSHLYQFRVGAGRHVSCLYGDASILDPGPMMEAEGRFIDDEGVPIDHLLVQVKDKIFYDYDFGDGWEHSLTLEKILVQPWREARIPRCLTGKRACPPEDVGGVWGYQRALDVRADPSHPDHADLSSWLGDSFDPDALDLEAVNRCLLQTFPAVTKFG